MNCYLCGTGKEICNLCQKRYLYEPISSISDKSVFTQTTDSLPVEDDYEDDIDDDDDDDFDDEEEDEFLDEDDDDFDDDDDD